MSIPIGYSLKRLKGFHGFTLVELLVVIAIISILAGLLLPSLQGAMDLSQSIKCRANLRQQGTAMQLYLNDYNNHWEKPMFSDGEGHPVLWYGALMYYSGMIDNISNAAFSSRKDIGIFFCPADRSENSSYLGNYVFSGGGTTWDAALDNRNFSSLKGPSKMMMVMGGQNVEYSANQNDCYRSVAYYLGVGQANFDLRFERSERHPENSVSTLYVDGHVGGISYSEAVVEYLLNYHSHFFNTYQKW